VGYFEKGENRENWKKELEELTAQREQKTAVKEPVIKQEKEPVKVKESAPEKAPEAASKPVKAKESAPEKAPEAASKPAAPKPAVPKPAAPKPAAPKPASSKRVAITFEQLEAEAFGKTAPSKAADKTPSISKNISKSK
jgi:hypothetical protein